ncbi:MAG: GIY-YIG nuclease family protein [Pseudomonadota bacterium]
MVFVYLMASRRNGTLYTGVTGDLIRRVFEHRTGAVRGFTRRYGVTRLVWWTSIEDALAAIQREKTIKKWPRRWKIALIEQDNPEWQDLWLSITR